jgi:hypothetical protein
MRHGEDPLRVAFNAGRGAEALAEGIVSELDKGGGTDRRVRNEIGPALIEAWESWVKHQNRSLASLLLTIAKPEIREILKLPDTAKTTVANLFGDGAISSGLPAGAERATSISIPGILA